MDDALTIVNWLLPLLYLLLLIDYGATFFLRVKTHDRNPWVIAVIAAHVAFLVLRGLRLGYPPLADNYEVLSLVAVSTAAVYWVLEIHGRDRRAGLFVFLAVFLFQYTSTVFLAHPITQGASHGAADYGWGRIHVVPAAFAYAALTFAGVYGLLNLVAQHNLKEHRFGVLFDRLPPLELLGRMTWLALLIGFALLTVSMVTGPFLFAQARSAGGTPVLESKVASKIIIGSTAWVICLVAMLGRLLGKWSLVWVSRIAVAGFVIVMALWITSVMLS